ncbi:binary toxin-like calcium binding domain-containing protein [Bacillus mycoides]|uniref:binary toxin-like calcium binding domain-containing protein n=1 Tax=Bacillus mycoides TaxID=1405 RepID=UPI001F08BBDC|nr:binary toxin-like calcium binding domain-containing protein [Bacillus mycoides]
MKKLNSALSVLGSVSMALTLASPALADVKQPNPGSTVEIFKENANAKKEDKNFTLGSDGEIGSLITQNIEMANNDWDKDGISNDLEINGYKIEFNSQTGKNEAKAWEPEKDKGKPKFISNPMNANTDGDPFTDMYEVENYNSDSETNFNPIVANMPNLQIGVKRIEVIPIATITDNNGGSVSRGWEKSVATQHSFNIGAGVEGGAMGSPAGPVPTGSASLNVGYGYSKTTTETESYTNNFDWSTAKTVDTAKAAKVRVHLEYKNVGTAGAENVSPHFNIRLGNKIINTVKATQDRYKANQLSTEKGGRNTTEVVIDSLDGQADANIVLSLDELKAVEQGELLSVEVLPTSTMEVSIEKDGQFMSVGDSGRIEARVNAATEQLETDIGNIPKFRVYTPKDKSLADKPVLSYNEVFQHINIDTNKVKHIVNKAKSNNQVSVVSDKTLSDLKMGKGDRGYLHNDAVHGAFQNIQQPRLVESSYDPVAKKMRASILPGLFGVSDEISATYRTKWSGPSKTVTLVKRENGYTYESKENIHHIQTEFAPSLPVKFEINDAHKLTPTNKSDSLVKYNTEFENYVADASGELVVEGTPYNISGSGTYWGSHHAHNRWEYLWVEENDAEKVNVIIERVGQPKPGQPIKKDEEVFIKFQNSVHSGYSYLKLQDGYIHLDQKQNVSTFKFDHAVMNYNTQYYKRWKIQSNGQDIKADYAIDYMKYGNGVHNGWSLSRAK